MSITSQSTSASRAPITMADGERLQLHQILYAQVMLRQGERTLLGSVADLYEDRDELKAVVKHFNGEDWPLRPNVALLTVLGTKPHDLYCPVRCWCSEAAR